MLTERTGREEAAHHPMAAVLGAYNLVWGGEDIGHVVHRHGCRWVCSVALVSV